MHIEIDQGKLYRRKMTDSVGSRIELLCCNCFLNECFELGCIGSTPQGNCQCRQDHRSL